MMIRISKVLSISGFFIAITLFFSSCPKNNTCHGEIVCIDLATGNPVPGATVKLFVPPSVPSPAGFTFCDGTVTAEKILTADASGRATFCLSLPATPSVLVTSGSLSGTGVIATEIGETISVPIKIK